MPKPAAPAKRKIDWKLWSRVALGFALFVGAAWSGMQVQAFLSADPRFVFACDAADVNCAHLEIAGTTYANRARIRNAFTADFGKSVFDMPLAERRRRLLAIDWVATASITRVWPDRILVSITERRPVAFAKLPVAGSNRHRLALIDREGVLLSLPPKVRFHLPVLSGIDEDQSDDDRRIRVKAMEHLLEDLGPQANGISEVNAARVEDMRVITETQGRGVELWLGDQRYRTRYQNFLNHYGEIAKHSGDASTFDLRLDDRILAR